MEGQPSEKEVRTGCVQSIYKSKFLGVYCAFLSSAGSPLHLLTAAMIQDISTPMILLVRSLEHFVVFTIIVVLTWTTIGDAWVRGEVAINIGHGLASAASLFFVYYALGFLPSADVYVISCATPIFSTVAAYFVLKEKFGFVQGLSAITVAVGAVIITKPTWLFGKGHNREGAWIGTLLAICSCIFTTIQALSVRKLQKTPTGIVIIFAAIVFTIVSVLLMVMSSDYRLPHCGRDSLLLLLGGACQIITNALQVFAGKLVKAGRLSVIKTSSVLFTYIFQVMLVGEIPTWHSLLGATLILVSVLLTTLKKCDFCDSCLVGPAKRFRSKETRDTSEAKTSQKYIVADTVVKRNITKKNELKEEELERLDETIV